MPFEDELKPVRVVPYHAGWRAEFEALAQRLSRALGAEAVAIDHVGSTSVPGLAAKDCVDVQVRVRDVDEARQEPLLAVIGFRCRPEPWNRTEVSDGRECRKLVFAPPPGERSCNVHLRQADGPNSRFALLFRDYLRADETARAGWGAFKLRLSESVPDLFDYGQIKATATAVLMAGAERWAADTGWTVG